MLVGYFAEGKRQMNDLRYLYHSHFLNFGHFRNTKWMLVMRGRTNSQRNLCLRDEDPPQPNKDKF